MNRPYVAQCLKIGKRYLSEGNPETALYFVDSVLAISGLNRKNRIEAIKLRVEIVNNLHENKVKQTHDGIHKTLITRHKQPQKTYRTESPIPAGCTPMAKLVKNRAQSPPPPPLPLPTASEWSPDSYSEVFITEDPWVPVYAQLLNQPKTEKVYPPLYYIP